MSPRLTLMVSIVSGCIAVTAATLTRADAGIETRRDALLDDPRTMPRLRNESRVRGVVEVTLTAAPDSLSLTPGSRTAVLAYNGRVPGPLLEVREGDSVIIHFRNELAEETTVHWHGLHIPFHADGSPFHPVPAGGTHDYVFRVKPGAAGTYWYHPHPHHRTGDQVARGLYGTIIVRAADDPLPPMTERLLILSDNRLQADGALDFPARKSQPGRVDAENGREGGLLFVNGRIAPTLEIRAGEVQRWRVINASAARIYRLSLPGHRLLHVGSDGGLFENPVEVDEILLANGERAEFLVRGTGAPGTRATLQSLPYDRYIPQTRPAEWNRPLDLLTLAYTPERPVKPTAIPAKLRVVPPIDTTSATERRFIVMSQLLINGRSMDMARVDVSSKVGHTEIWDVENVVGMDHPFHLHGFQFQLLSRNGVPEKDRRWKDVVLVPKHETARFVVRFDSFAGKWMFHCHILDHEDQGMMGVLEVTPKGESR